MPPHVLRPVLLALSVAAATAPAAAQEAALVQPEDWKVRTDDPGADASDELWFVEMPPGWHVSTGPRAVLWDPETVAEGTFRAEMEVYLFDPGPHREAFGLVLGGQELEGPGRRYVCFLVREGGEYALERHVGQATRALVGWRTHPAFVSWTERPRGEETARNVLAVEALRDEVRFLLNGREVVKLPRGVLPPLDGVVGVRVHEHLTLHVSRLEVVPR